MKKEEARQLGLRKRKAIPEEKRRRDEQSLFSQMKERSKGYSRIGCYVSMKDEADTLAFLSWAFQNGKQIAVPKVRENTLDFYEIDSFDSLKPGCFGVMEPFEGRPVSADEIDLMFVPLSSIDRKGGRVGYGRGYYDSVLSDSMHKAGIAFREQEVSRIETDSNDVRLDEVIVPEIIRE